MMQKFPQLSPSEKFLPPLIADVGVDIFIAALPSSKSRGLTVRCKIPPIVLLQKKILPPSIRNVGVDIFIAALLSSKSVYI